MEPNIEEFLFSASQRLATKFFRATMDEVDRYWKLTPIEQPVFIALKLCIAAMEREQPYRWEHDWRSKSVQSNFFKITPHAIVEFFEVDFLVETADRYRGPRCVVECDSQIWHERTPEERAFEKMRDRTHQCAGFMVFRYTGKQIRANAFRVASDILARVVRSPEGEEACASTQREILDSLEHDPYMEVPL